METTQQNPVALAFLEMVTRSLGKPVYGLDAEYGQMVDVEGGWKGDDRKMYITSMDCVIKYAHNVLFSLF